MATPVQSGSYAEVLASVKRDIQAARTRAVLAVNSELIALYWRIGRRIVELQAAEGPRAQVVARLSADLRAPSIRRCAGSAVRT